MKKSKLATILIVIFTLLLAGVAVFTAMRLYNTRNQAVAPNAPSSKPAAQENTNQLSNACQVSFTIDLSTPTPVPECNSTCTTDSQCPTSMECYIESGKTTGSCRSSLCLTESSCVCPTATATATATSTATATATSTATATATANPQCNTGCTSNNACPSDMICYIPSGQSSGTCRNPQCLNETDCLCPQPTSTATATSTSTTVAKAPELPESGTSWPTILGGVLGVVVIIGALILAL